jgi:histidinol-phosphate aminotransferase
VAPLPRTAGAGFEAYRWAATVAEVAERHGLSPAHVLRFDANVPAFPAPLSLPAEAALRERAEYPEGSYRELREAAAGYAGCAPDEVAIDAGADGLIGLVARAYLGPDAVAVTESPTYPLHPIASRIEGADVRTAPRDLAALVEAARDAQVVWLCNPGNPSGELWPAAEVVRLAEALPDALVAVDEAYFEYGGETVADAATQLPNLVAIRTLSKAFGMAGLRVGYAVASREVAGVLSARRAPAPIATTAAALAAGALRDPPVEYEVMATLAERIRVAASLAAAGFETPMVHANFVVVRTTRAPELAADLERRGLVVRAYAESLRVTVRSPADDDLVLQALGAEAPPAAVRSATVLGPGVRASLVLDGGGRVRSATGDFDRDRDIEERSADAGFDLDLVADLTARAGDVTGALEEAIATAGG